MGLMLSILQPDADNRRPLSTILNCGGGGGGSLLPTGVDIMLDFAEALPDEIDREVYDDAELLLKRAPAVLEELKNYKGRRVLLHVQALAGQVDLSIYQSFVIRNG